MTRYPRTRITGFLLALHASIAFAISVLLLVTKWFPYGSPTVRLREWLYRFF